jgi:hypothetical protein
LPADPRRLGPTRARDLIAVAVVAAAAAYLITRLTYSTLPTLPRLAGVTAALLGAGEAIAGVGLRGRIRDNARRPGGDGAAGRAPRRPPVPPLVAARALAAAKASALAGAAVAGLWFGFGLYVVPESPRVTAAGADTVTAVIGLICAGVLLAGALFLESCCRAPDDGAPGGADRP